MTAQQAHERRQCHDRQAKRRPHIRTGREPPASPASGARAPAGRRAGCSARPCSASRRSPRWVPSPRWAAFGRADAAVLTNCAANAQHLRLPGRDEHRRTRGTTLKSVPSQVSSGPGWSYNAAGNDVIVNVNGTVLSGLYIPYNLVINANNVTVKDVQVVTSGNFGISLTHTTGVTIENSTISGQNATTGRVGSAID